MVKNRQWPEWYRVLQGRDFLFPDNTFKFKTIPEGLWKYIQKRAAELLKERPTAPLEERLHWQSLIDGNIPYGFTVETKKGRNKNAKNKR